ncbi:MAG: WXG100 family type VII secretion target [Bacilli bacterium]
MSRIRLDIEQMLQVANKYDGQVENVDNLIRELDRMLVELQTYWEGSSANKFEEHYLEIKPSILRLKDIILETSNIIKHTANSILEVDRTIIG